MAVSAALALVAAVLLTVGACLHRLVLTARLHPRVLQPGLPHNRDNATRLWGDLPAVAAHAAQHGCTQSEAVFAAVTQRPGAQTPIAQLLTPRFVAPHPIVLVDDPREVEDILRRRGREFDRSAMTAAFFAPLLPRASIAQFTTPHLKAQKKLWADSVNPAFLKTAAVPHARLAARRLAAIWRCKARAAAAAAAGSGGGGDGTFNAVPDFLDATMDLMWALVLGSDLGVLLDKLSSAKKDMMASRSSGTVNVDQHHHVDDDDDDDDEAGGTCHDDLGLSKAAESSRNMFFDVTGFLEHESSYIRSGWAGLRLKFIQYTPRYRRVKQKMESEMRRLVTDARTKFQRATTTYTDDGEGGSQDAEGAEKCAMDMVLRRELQAAQKEGVVRATSIEQELMLFMIAGIDSTAYTLAWCVKFLSRHQAIQHELRQALQSAYAHHVPGLPSADAIATQPVPYLDAFLHETLRFAVTAGSVNRRVTVDTQILGYPIAAGTELVMNTRVLQRPPPCDERLRSVTSREAQLKRPRGGIEGPSGDCLDKFNPRRWLYVQDDGSDAFDPEALPTLVFSHGIRGCFGKRLAMYDLRVFVIILVLSFEFLPVPEEADDWAAEEAIFRYPKQAQLRLRALP